MSRKLALSVSVISLIALGACQSTGSNTKVASNEIDNASGVKASSSENILKAEGNWDLVEQESTIDPLDMHKSARKGVNPANKAKKKFYSDDQLANVAGTHGEEDTRYRLIRMERNMKGIQDNLMLADKEIIVAQADAQNLKSSDFDVIPSKKPALEYKPLKTIKTASNDKKNELDGIGFFSKARAVVEQEQVAHNDAAVNSIRFGEHPGKTRMVLDLTGASTYKADVDNNEHVLFVELSKADWATTGEKVLSHPLVAAYATQPSKSGGTTLALKLKKPVKIVGSAALPPSSSKGHRIYLDLAAS